MELYSLLLIILWITPLWLSGWLMLPASRHFFPCLPDGGLAAGRLLTLLLASLVAFWAASLQLVSLSYSCWILPAIPICVVVYSTLNSEKLHEFRQWISKRKKALWVSDLIFLLSFLFFIYLRLCQPEIRDQEKPMDSAIIGVLARTAYLPAQNPWFSGELFTNYYYFGHFMGSMLKRVFLTPLPYSYNLIQPVFCALFVSILWSLCASLAQSLRAGVLAASSITFAGNYEPLRQFFQAWHSEAPLWNLDWWSTSRVVPNTINEYPFFTLSLGDAHAHFFALSLGVLLLCLCQSGIHFKLSDANSDSLQPLHKIKFTRHFLAALTLGAIIMTNAWDAPLYFVLFTVVLFADYRNQQHLDLHRKTQQIVIRIFLFCIPVLTAYPFLSRFKNPTGGVIFESWIPSFNSLLHWGSFVVAIFFFTIGNLFWKTKCVRPSGFQCFVGMLGTIAVALPCFFYIKGHFAGDLRHQDTVFKFWLQGWLLLGIALFPIAFRLANSMLRSTFKYTGFTVVFLIAIYLIPATATIAMIKSRLNISQQILSLNGARFLPHADQTVVFWLDRNATSNTTIIEAVGKNPDGSIIGAYTNYGRISFLTGIPTYLAWPQHVSFWGIDYEEIFKRQKAIDSFYSRFTSGQQSLGNKFTHALPLSPTTTWVIWGDLEQSAHAHPASLKSPSSSILQQLNTIFQSPTNLTLNIDNRTSYVLATHLIMKN